MKISYTEIFKRHVRKLNKRYRSLKDDLELLTNELKEGIVLGDRITGLDDIVYKVRVKNSDNQKGKSGGYRIIYYLKAADEVKMVAMYVKSDQENISIESLRRILSDDQLLL
jgi:mRNA-degrading endonuclease RelE of RelBE toxin-antitoxin system